MVEEDVNEEEIRGEPLQSIPTDNDERADDTACPYDFTAPIILSDEQWDWFVELLEHPPEPTEALRELFRRYG